MRILAIDDDIKTLALLRRTLGRRGFDNVSVVDSMAEARARLEAAWQPYDMVVTSARIAEDCGIALCRDIRQREDYSHAPIVVIGSGTPPDTEARAIDAGATDFMELPLEEEELGARIARAAGHAQETRRTEAPGLTEAQFAACFAVQAGQGIWSFEALEADLLQRERDAVYAMTLFSVEIEGARALADKTSPTGFHAAIESVSTALAGAVDIEATRFAYAGRGVFVGIIYCRDQVDLADIERDATAALAVAWDVDVTGQPLAPVLSGRAVGDKRLWTGSAAAEALRACQGAAAAEATGDGAPSDPLVVRAGNV